MLVQVTMLVLLSSIPIDLFSIAFTLILCDQKTIIILITIIQRNIYWFNFTLFFFQIVFLQR